MIVMEINFHNKTGYGEKLKYILHTYYYVHRTSLRIYHINWDRLNFNDYFQKIDPYNEVQNRFFGID